MAVMNTRGYTVLHRCAVAVSWLVFAGCACPCMKYAPGGRCPLWPRLKAAAIDSLRHPGTWAPAIGAGVVALRDADREISDNAIRHTPVFGSCKSAERWGDSLAACTEAGMVVTALAFPAGRDPWLPKVSRIGVEYLGWAAAANVTSGLKDLTDRERPGGNEKGFPSGLATVTGASAAMCYENIDLMPLAPALKLSLKVLPASATAAAAWARVEAGAHYPTDVLVGCSVGNFFSLLVYKTFFGRTKAPELSTRFLPSESALLTVSLPF